MSRRNTKRISRQGNAPGGERTTVKEGKLQSKEEEEEEEEEQEAFRCLGGFVSSFNQSPMEKHTVLTTASSQLSEHRTRA
jgi:hypothetical protein